MILVTAITALLVVSNLYILIPIGDYLVKYYHLSTQELSLCSSAFSTSYAFGFLLWGVLADRYGNKRIVTFGLVILTGITFAFGRSIEKENIIFFRFLQGIFAASFAPAILSYLSSTLVGRKKVVSIGILSSSFMISGIVGQIISVNFIMQHGLSLYLIILSVGYLVCSIVLYLVLRDDARIGVCHKPLNFSKRVMESLSNNNLRPYYIVTFTLLLSFVGMYSALNEILSMNTYLSLENIKQLRPLGIFGMFISPFAFSIAQRIGRKKTICFALLLTATTSIILSYPSSFVALVIFTNLFNLGIALTCPLVMNEISVNSTQNRSIALALYTSILFIGASIGGYLSTSFGNQLSKSTSMRGFGLILLLSFFVIKNFTSADDTVGI